MTVHPTTQAVIDLLDTGEEMHMSDIAQQIGVTRQRVAQICWALGRKPAWPYKRRCKTCRAPLYGALEDNTYCSEICRPRAPRISLVCSICGNTMVRRKTAHRQWQARQDRGKGSGMLFCSKQCQGKWVSSHYGFGSRPQNRRYG